MKKEDTEFWNGVSKGIFLCIEKLKEMEDPMKIEDCIRALREESERVGRLHVLDVRDFLRAHLQ